MDKLDSIFGDQAPSTTRLSSLQDEFREGHSKSIVVPKTLDSVCELCTSPDRTI